MAARGVTWRLEEMETLAELWTDEEVQNKFTSMVHNGKIWDELAVKFQELTGVERTGAQLKIKFKRMKKWYREYKKGQGKSGAAGDCDELWDIMDRVEGGKELTNPSHTGDTLLTTTSTTEYGQDEDEEDLQTAEAETEDDINSRSGSPTYLSDLDDDDIDGDMELIERKKKPKQRATKKRTSTNDVGDTILASLSPIPEKLNVQQKAMWTLQKLRQRQAAEESSVEDCDDPLGLELGDGDQMILNTSTPVPKPKNNVPEKKRRVVATNPKPANKARPNKARPNTLDKMDMIFTQMAEQQKVQQTDMLGAISKMQKDMIKQQLEFEREAQKSAQEHELKIMQLLMSNKQVQPQPQYQQQMVPRQHTPAQQFNTAWQPHPLEERNAFSSVVTQSLNLLN